MAEPIRLGGMKLSGELVQLDLLEPTQEHRALVKLLTLLSEANVNIPHLHQGNIDGGMQSTLCIGSQDYLSLKSTLLQTVQNFTTRITSPVGSITLFPHKNSLELVSIAHNVLLTKNIPVHGCSSSVSALVIHTDFTLLEEAASTLLTKFELPENHSPFRPDYTLKQVVKD